MYRGRSRSCTLEAEVPPPTGQLGRLGHQDVIDLEEEGEVEIFQESTIDLTETNTHVTALDEGDIVVTHVHQAGITIAQGDFLQVKDVLLGHLEIDFVHVEIVAQDRAGRIKVRGTPFVRTRKLHGRLPKKPNEICKVVHHITGNVWGNNVHNLVEVVPGSIIRKRLVVITNSLWPHHCTRDRTHPGADSPLVCRWKLICTFQAADRRAKAVEEALVRIHYSEVIQTKYRVLNQVLSFRWRGDPSIINLAADNARREKRYPKYTVFDSFSGAGGVSQGAQMAGFKVKYAVDKEAGV